MNPIPSNDQLLLDNYPLKEGYKQTEVGVIPEDWEVRAVGDICDFIVPGRNKPKIFNGDIPWITTPDIENGGTVSESKLGLFVSRDETKNVGSKIVPRGSVIMSCVGELGIVAFVTKDIVINQQLHAFIPSSIIDATFLMNALQTQKDLMVSLATKTAVPYLNKDNCNSIVIPFPPLPEQRAIAEILSDVDALLAALDKLITKKRVIKMAAMQQLLTGKTRLPGFGAGQGYKQTEIGMIPEGWEITTLGEAVEFLDGKRKPIKESERAKMRGIYPYYGASGIVDYVNDYLFDEDLILLGEDGENILSRNTRLAFRVKGKIWVNNHAHVLRIRAGYDINFLTDYLESLDYSLYNSGTAQPKLNKYTCEKIPVLKPSKYEQHIIAEVLSDMDAEISALETRRAKTAAIKQGMMQELLTGRTRLVDRG